MEDYISVLVKTNKKEDRVIAISPSEYIVELREKPIKGKANEALVKLLRHYFNSKVEIVKGLKSRKKIIRIY